MKKILTLVVALATLCCCQKHGQFHIAGAITGAADTMLYLEHLSLAEGAVAIDSVRLTEEGTFAFASDTLSGPEFYRLRIGGQCINLAIDSTESVTVKACLDSMSFGYKVEGSGVCDTIRLMCLRLADLERQARRLAVDRRYTVEERNTMLEELVIEYKKGIKQDFIQNNYGTSYSYYACFQTLGGKMLFNPIRDKSDLTWMRAVGNAWSERYPHCQRTENLFNIIQEGRRAQAKPREIVLDFDNEKVQELGIIDMTFPDINGRDRQLSSLRGKVVLLDFTAFSVDGSTERTLLMRELYSKYHDRGLEIYQVSVDPNEHYWKQKCEELPWVSVYCEEGLESDMLTLYNVQRIPTYFLIDRNCDLQARQDDIADIEKAIEKLL